MHLILANGEPYRHGEGHGRTCPTGPVCEIPRGAQPAQFLLIARQRASSFSSRTGYVPTRLRVETTASVLGHGEVFLAEPHVLSWALTTGSTGRVDPCDAQGLAKTREAGCFSALHAASSFGGSSLRLLLFAPIWDYTLAQRYSSCQATACKPAYALPHPTLPTMKSMILLLPATVAALSAPSRATTPSPAASPQRCAQQQCGAIGNYNWIRRRRAGPALRRACRRACATRTAPRSTASYKYRISAGRLREAILGLPANAIGRTAPWTPRVGRRPRDGEGRHARRRRRARFLRP